MAYTPATKVPDLTEISFFQWEIPSAPAPRLASPIVASDTIITFTSPPLDHTGAVIATDFLMGIENTDGYVETVLVHAGDLSVDGLTATGVIRGIRLEGLDWTTSDTSLASDFNQDSAVFCNISGVLQALNTAGLTAQIGANIKFNGRPLFMGSGVAACPVFATTIARDAAITAPLNGDMCYVTADGVFYDYTAGAWVARAAGTTPNASTAVAGKVQIATNAQMGAGTSVGSTGALLVPPNSQLVQTSSGAGDQNKLATLNASGQFASGFVNSPSNTLLTAKGALITATAANMPATQTVGSNDQVLTADSAQANGIKWAANFTTKNGISTFNLATATGTQTIAHGLGKIPKITRINSSVSQDEGGGFWVYFTSYGVYDGTTTASISNNNYNSGVGTGSTATAATTNIIQYINHLAGSQTATITVDATNITLSWTKVNGGSAPSGTLQIMFEVQG